jgi:maleate isomerase
VIQRIVNWSQKMKADNDVKMLDFSTDGGLGSRARLGLIILQTDQTIEHEFAGVFGMLSDVALYATRIPNSMTVSPRSLQQMAVNLQHAAELLPPRFEFNVIGFACTSGATMIGENRVDELIRKIHPEVRITNPLSACKAAMTALKLNNIAMITPYNIDVTLEMQTNLRASGFNISTVSTFNQSDDFEVARISEDSILNALLRVGAHKECDGVFVACTSLRAFKVIAKAEAIINKPVISSNQALAWHMMRLAGVGDKPKSAGRLFETILY